MYSGQMEQTWRGILISGLQEHYGISEDEARSKVDVWFQRVSEEDESIEAPMERRSKRRLRRPRAAGIQLTVRRRRRS
jgi:hypothetical protein